MQAFFSFKEKNFLKLGKIDFYEKYASMEF
jgi:hypothetical protein